MSRYVFPLLLGVVGVAILCSLGTWQLHRLTWKEAMLADIETRISATPIDFSTLTALDAERDQYLPVTVTGRTTGQEADVLSGLKKDEDGVRRLQFYAVQFDGVLQVTDADLLVRAVQAGIGSGKGFGFGLLSLAPVRG